MSFGYINMLMVGGGDDTEVPTDNVSRACRKQNPTTSYCNNKKLVAG